MPQMMNVDVEVSGEMIADTMNEDPNFAYEVWKTLAMRLDMGLMADQLLDLLAGDDESGEKRVITSVFQATFDCIEQLHFSED